MAQTDRKRPSGERQVEEICKEYGRTFSESHLPGIAQGSSPADITTPSRAAGVPIPAGRTETNLHRQVASLCASRDAELLHAAQANLQALLHIAKQRISRRGK
jgi:hypothetical protein